MKTKLFAAFIATAGAAAHAAQENPSPKELLVFKNGFAVVHYGFSPASENFQAGLSNRAAHGTVWFRCGEDASCVTQVRSKATVYEEVAKGLSSPRDLLPLANGNVKLLLADKSTVEGKVAGIFGSEGRLPMGRVATENINTVVLNTTDGMVLALNAGDIQQVSFAGNLDLPAFTVEPGRPAPDRMQNLDVTLRPGANKKDVKMSALEWGYTWSPTYLIDLIGEDKAQLQLKATVLNEGADLKNTKISLAAGWANLVFRRQPDAMHTVVNINQYLSGLSEPDTSMRRESMAMQRMTNNMAAPAYYNANDDYTPPSAQATQKEDLHLYWNKPVDLKTGDRLTLQLFAETIKREHIYEWNVGDTSGQGRVTEPMYLTHKLRLKNTTGAPWTTAPIAITKDGGMVAQGVLDYTPKGAVQEVEVSRALDFALSGEDSMRSKEGRDVLLAGRTRLKIPGSGKLNLKNLRPHPVKIVVKKTVYGQISKTSPQAKVTETQARYAYDNATSLLVWEREVKPGEAVSFAYDYTTLKD